MRPKDPADVAADAHSKVIAGLLSRQGRTPPRGTCKACSASVHWHSLVHLAAPRGTIQLRSRIRTTLASSRQVLLQQAE